MTNATFGTLNLHRMDCNRKHPYPCDPWQVRAPRFPPVLNRMRASVYAWQECLPIQADDLAQFLSWGSMKNPPWVIDENFNVVAWDRRKWTDVEVEAHSLSAKPGDKGDVNRRSVLWVLLHHLATGKRVWFGSSHLETGDPAARLAQAKVLAAKLPAGPKVLGMDRNSFDTSDPSRTIQTDLPSLQATGHLANPTKQRSFHGWTTPVFDGKCVDGIHSDLPFTAGQLVSTAGLKATDHSGLTATITIGD